MLSNSYINLISTPDEVLAYTKRKRLTPAESHILSLCTPPPNFFSPLPSCKPPTLNLALPAITKTFRENASRVAHVLDEYKKRENGNVIRIDFEED